MDKLDLKILRELMHNSRTPLTQLAKKIRTSREVLTYRINKLKKDKIIIEFTTEININKLGFIGSAVFLNIKSHREQEFKRFLQTCGFVSWVARHSGIWNFGFSIIAKTNEELDKKFLKLYNKFKEDILNHRFTLHKKSHFFYEKYFGSKPITKTLSNPEKYKIDSTDKKILKEISKNSRIDCVTLSKNLKITPQATLQRIKKLRSSQYIEHYSIFVDISRLNLFQYSIFIKNKNIENRKKLTSYLTQHPKINFIAEYIGDPFLEFGIFVDDPYKLRTILQEIEEAFPDNRVLEISLFQEEFVSIGPPDCVFE